MGSARHRNERRLARRLAWGGTVAVALAVGVVPPAHGTTTLPHGPDVSGWQHVSGAAITWSKVAAAGNSFGIIKATEGTSYVNPYYVSDTTAARAAGLVVGAYHFARPALPISTAVTQADDFVAALARTGGVAKAKTLPPILDLEVNGGLSAADLVTWTQTWLETVRKLTGRTPIVYSYPYFWPGYMANSYALHRYPLWLAAYQSSAPSPIGGWPTWTMWQYTSSATVSGIAGHAVDMSYFHGTSTQLLTLANGTASSTWTVSAPAAPVGITASPGAGSVTVSWVPSDDGGQVPSAYVVTASDGRKVTVSGTGSRATVTGLTNGRLYTFRVQAVNSAGTSALSAASPAVAPGQPPSTPTSLRAVAGNGQVTVSWSASTYAPTQYTLYRCSPAPCTATTPYFRLPGTTFLNTIVTNGVGYGYAVSASNGFGSSPRSATVTATPVGPPGEPRSLVAKTSGTSVTLTWAAPASNGGTAITAYRLTVDGAVRPLLPGNAVTYTQSNLTVGKHAFTIAAVNRIGTGPANSITVASTLGAPQPPTTLTATPTSDGATLAWQPPASSGGSPVTGYHVSVDGTAVASLPATTLTYTATGLSLLSHTFAVTALNALGESSPATVQAAPVIPVTRTAGADRYQTSQQLYGLTGPCNKVAVLARGDLFPDALAASYLASVEGAGLGSTPGGPQGTAVLLTPPDGLPAATLDTMRQMGVSKVFIVGGTGAVSAEVAAQLASTRPYLCGTATPTALGSPMQVIRIAGATRYATAAQVATYVGAAAVGTADYSPTHTAGAKRTAILVTGQNFPDAVVAGPAAYWHQFPILLTPTSYLNTTTRAALKTLHIAQVVIVGGPAAVTTGVENTLHLMGIATKRVYGADRTGTAAAAAQLFFAGKASTLARGDDFADALAAAPLIGRTNSALLLTRSTTSLGTGTVSFLAHNAGTLPRLWVIGGAGAVPDTLVQQAIAALTGS